MKTVQFKDKKIHPIIEIKRVNHHFGQGEAKKQILFDNNIVMFPGEIVIMTGPSGSGKTTLLSIIGALRSVQEGSLKVMGKELKGLCSKEQEQIRKNIGFIFQLHNLIESLTAFQNVKLATELFEYKKKAAFERTEEILSQVGLKDRMHYIPQRLSGGQKQRVAIARALVNKPSLILADEPTAALDKDTGRQIVTLFQKLAEENKCTILIVTHDNRILDVAHRIINMDCGYVKSNVDVNESLTIVHFLKNCDVFKKSAPQLLADIANRMLMEFFQESTYVFHQGDIGDKFYIIRSGMVEVLITKNGKSEKVAELKDGDFFGELALLKDMPRSASIRAITPVDLLSLSKEIFLETINSSPTFEQFVRNHYIR